MSSLPIKTGDLVVKNGQVYLVRSVRMTHSGAIADVYPVAAQKSTFKVDDFDLLDEREKTHRIKSIGASSQKIQIPDGLTPSEASRVLMEYVKGKRDGR